MQHYEPHPAAVLFPVLGEDELQKLADDIRANGLLEPIVLHEGKVLDGRNRLEACKRAGVEPKFRVDNRITSPILFVLSKNLHRRHLTPSERSIIAAEAVPLLEEEAEKRQSWRTKEPQPQLNKQDSKRPPRGGHASKAVEMAAEEAQVGKSSVYRAMKLKECAPEEFERARRGEVTVGEAFRKLPAGPKGSRTQRTSIRRAAQIRELAAQGCRAGQIAAKIGVSEERVRLLAKRHEIQLPDKFIGKRPKLDVNRIVQETVIGAQGLVAGLDLVEGNLDQLDRTQVPGWVTVLAASIKTLTTLLNQLKEVCK